jgi:hypothetical protein
VEFEAPISVTVRITVFCRVTSCNVVETAGFCETSMYFYIIICIIIHGVMSQKDIIIEVLFEYFDLIELTQIAVRAPALVGGVTHLCVSTQQEAFNVPSVHEKYFRNSRRS